MPGTFTLDDNGVVLTYPATPVAVCGFDPSQADDEDRYRLLPNIVCDRIERPIGAQPSTARFHYLLDNSGIYPDWPSQFEEIWPQTARSGPYVVVTDDRIAVIAWTPKGERRMLFDGYAQIPQVNFDGGRQNVSFVATGVEIRAWDVPIGGRVQRDSDDPNDGPEVQTDLPVRFNPSDGKGGILPNCTPDDHDVDEDDNTISYPVFVEEHLERSPDPRTVWTVEKAARYILRTQNADERYILNPSMRDLTNLLQARVPNPPDGVINPDDPSTYTVKDMPIRDMDISNQAWPEALESLLQSIGFGFYFGTPRVVEGDHPTTTLYVFRIDSDKRTPKTMLLDEYGSTIDPQRNDVASLALARDVNHVVNAFSVETPVKRWEVSIVLAPGFTPAAGDADPSQWKQFFNAQIKDATATVARKYRWYVADECADGHWNGSSFVTNVALDLSPLFPDDNQGNPTYVRRYRPGSHKLLTLDEQKRPRKAMLHYSQDYAGAYPAVWNNTGTWKPIASGWTLLEHRLGIQVTIGNPQQWHTGTNQEQINGITWQAAWTSGKRFWLLLTTVIDDDIMLPSVVPKRIASPTRFERRRRVDARDHYQYQAVYYPSWNNKTSNDDIVIRNDTEKALTLARQYRSAHEMPALSGTVTIPYITNYYGLGDKIAYIEGRDVTLKANAASDKGEARRFPTIVKVAWDFTGTRQSTSLHLTDLRAEVRF